MSVTTARTLATLGSLPAAEAMFIPAGQAITRAGEPSDHAWLVESGLFVRHERKDGLHRTWVGPGMWAGDVAALTDETHLHDVIAWRDSVAWRVSKDACRDVLSGKAGGFIELGRYLIARTNPSPQPRTGAHVITFITFGAVETAEVAALLRRALGGTDAEVLDPVRAVAELGQEVDDISPVERVRWAEQYGSTKRLRCLVAQATPHPWAQSAVRCADHVIAVAEQDRGIDLTTVESAVGLDTTARRKELLLLTGGGLKPVDATSLLGAIVDVHRVHAVDRTAGDAMAAFVRNLIEENSPGRLGRFDLFEGLDETHRVLVQDHVQWTHVDAGHVLVSEGEEARDVYLLHSGRFEVVTSAGADDERIVAELGGGQVVGEMAWLSGSPRSATVRARRDGSVGRITGADFGRLMSALPQLATRIAAVMAQRHTSRTVVTPRPAPRTLAVLPLDTGERTRALPERLAAAAARSGLRACFAHRETVERALGPGMADRQRGEPGHPEVQAWLHRLEQQFDLVVLLGDRKRSAWTERCVRQADRVLLAADAALDPEPGTLEQTLGPAGPAGQQRRHLMLLHPAGVSEADGTRRWLRRRPGIVHHHLRDAHHGDADRALRRVLERAVGLALAGASSRGAAHLGVHRAMGHVGLPVDVISGSSSGAAVAMFIAMGLSHEDALENSLRMVNDIGVSVGHLQPPTTSLMSGAQLNHHLRLATQDRRLEDQFIPIHITAVDISRHELITLSTGVGAHATRASMSLPAIWPPVSTGDRMLADGGIMSYMPVEPLLPECHRGLVVGSDLDPVELRGEERAFQDCDPYGVELSGWRQLWRKWIPGLTPIKAPALMDVLFHSMAIPSFESADRVSELERAGAVTVVKVPVGGYGFFEVDRKTGKEMERIGFETASETLSAHAQRWTAGRTDGAG